MSLAFQIPSMIKAIANLESRKDVVCGNIEKSRLLIERCVQFQSLLETLEKSPRASASLEPCLDKFKNVIDRSIDLVDNFCQPGWLRLILNVTNANKFNQEFESLNLAISECRSDLHLGLDIAAQSRQEDIQARANDDHKLLSKIYEMLTINSIDYSAINMSSRSRSGSMSDAFALTIAKLQQEIPGFDDIIEDTETFLDTIYSPDADIEDDFFDAPSDDPSESTKQRNGAEESHTGGMKRTASKHSLLHQVLKNAQIIRDKLHDIENLGLWKPRANDVLGKGSFGIVYKGFYENEEVAIKAIQGFGCGIPPSELKKIEREIFILAKCNHPNIIHFRGCDLNEGLLLTELAVTNLFSMAYGMYHGKHAPASLSCALKMCWLHDIAAGIQYLHFFDIIHRDLKPHNILLAIDISIPIPRLVAKITDFGVSSVAGLSSTMGSTTAGNAVGTTSYKAPELFSRKIPLKQRYSKAVDIYAFGVLANELFAGEIPWTDCSAEDIAMEVREGGRPQQFTASCREEEILLTIIGTENSGCFAQDRSLRPEACSICKQLPVMNYVPPAPSPNTLHRSASTSGAIAHRAVKMYTDINPPPSSPSLRRAATDPVAKATLSKSAVSAADKAKYITAAQGGNITTILHLLDTTDISIETASHDGMTALLWMVQYDQYDSIMALLERGADLNVRNKDGCTALIVASEQHVEGTDTVRLLLDEGCDVNATDTYGWTSLMKSCHAGRVEIARVLIQRGANVEAKFVGKTSLMYAAWKGHKDCVELLLDANADIESMDYYNETALDYAIKYYKLDIVELLRSRGATELAPVEITEEVHEG